MLERKIFYLIIGFICSIISIGRYNFPLLIFIWPFCFLSYLHQNEKKVVPLIIVSACLIISNILRWLGISNSGILPDLVMGVYYSVINIIPFIIDDIIYHKVTKWASIFIFPLLVSCIEYIFAFLPFANYNLYAYALRNNIYIIQICSLFDVYFLSFINIIITLLIISFGSIRLLIPESGDRFIIAASLGLSPCLYEEGKESDLPIDIYLDYIQKTIIKANNSEAKLIVYSEEAFSIYAADRSEIISKTAKLAEKYNIYVVLPLDVEYEADYLKNEAILISDKGDVLYNYQKKNLIPISENQYYNNMTEVKTFYTDLGYLGVVVCYDIDFPYYINRLSNLGLDNLLIPSWDWDGSTEFHSTEIRFRSIENGFNTMKSTAHGIVLSTDYKGRFLSYFESDGCTDYFVLSTVYKRGTRTLYLYIGIVFNYIYFVALIIVIIMGKYKLNKENIDEGTGNLIN